MPSTHWTSLILETLEQFIATLGAVLPKLVAAVALIALGLLVAHFLRSAVLRLARNIDRLLGRLFGHRFSAGVMRAPWPLSRILATAAYWLVLLFFITATAEVLGFPGMADWIGRLASYLPMILAAAGIVVFGVLSASVARESVSALPLREAELLARASYLLIVTVSIIIGIDQLGVEVTLLANVVTIAAAALLGSIGLAFGLGARSTVSNIIAGQYVKNTYTCGQRIRIDGVEGIILEIAPTAVVLEAADGRITVPTSRFESAITTVLIGEGKVIA